MRLAVRLAPREKWVRNPSWKRVKRGGELERAAGVGEGDRQPGAGRERLMVDADQALEPGRHEGVAKPRYSNMIFDLPKKT